MFSDYILLSKGVSVLGLKTYARFLHNSSVVYNNINAKKHNTTHIAILLLKYQCTYFSTPKRRPYLSCYFYIAKNYEQKGYHFM